MTDWIITIASMKGGSGKSTLASCLAVQWHLNGRRTIIVDADPQRSIARLAARERALDGVPVISDSTEEAWKVGRNSVGEFDTIIFDTPGFHSQATLACLSVSDLVLVPLKPSPFDVDRMIDTLNLLINGASGERPIYRCILTQTVRDSVIAKHIRAELTEAGFPVLTSEMTNRVAYPEAALWGATPSLIDRNGAAARDIQAIANEVRWILANAPQFKQTADA